MVAIAPFRALRYDPAMVESLEKVIAPPYDVIDEAEQARLYDASPYNIVRLILGRQHPADTEQENRYTRARRDFEAWRRGGALQLEAREALYVIEHAFTRDGRRHARLGFLALLELGEETPRHILRHEATLAAPKADRTKLLEALPANLSPVFCVYPDEGGALQSRLAGLTAQPPSGVAALHGEPIRLWTVTAADVIEAVKRQLAGTAVLIADGHHRFEVAYAHRQRYPRVMCYFVSMADPGLVMRAIHRVVRPLQPAEAAALQELCAAEPARDLKELLGWLSQDAAPGCFGRVDGGRCEKVRVRPQRLAAWQAQADEALRRLDVGILHRLLLPGVGVSPPEVQYAAEAPQAVEMARKGQGSAWLLRPIPVRQVYELAAAGVTLPPKSTFFYPKVPSGLAINPLG
ncbi:MAG: DUF1015 domain-containing protein [Candidatus Omnitrophica bacterium]|nr:DUF1015 domain-containing protein [Candidatus Omnitrophota bacterium]